ncbi:hypothetical protein JTE90_000633 [Oedothorax gibbosus]|uniref:Uncharacterized protein n=1 Tax=Oedothorax gibbosus TaxID=931172 RepID=A0AAV6VVG6_9ARAC|nr:hypothetical protein JTE90_000633 [Oedothorax gibbosus]
MFLSHPIRLTRGFVSYQSSLCVRQEFLSSLLFASNLPFLGDAWTPVADRSVVFSCRQVATRDLSPEIIVLRLLDGWCSF